MWTVGNREEMRDNEGIGKGFEVDERRMVGEEGRKKVGRLKKIKEFCKERRGSTGCVEDYFTRK